MIYDSGRVTVDKRLNRQAHNLKIKGSNPFGDPNFTSHHHGRISEETKTTSTFTGSSPRRLSRR